MARRTKVAVDIDGVCADFLGRVIETWGEPRVPNAYSLEEMYPCRSDDEIYDLVTHPLTYSNLKIIPGSVEGIRRLREAGMDVFFVTSRPKEVMIETVWWLMDKGFVSPGTHADRIVHWPKLSFMINEGADVLLEDKLTTAQEVMSTIGDRCRVLLLDQPYNSGPCGGAIRCGEWEKGDQWEEVIENLLGGNRD